VCLANTPCPTRFFLALCTDPFRGRPSCSPGPSLAGARRHRHYPVRADRASPPGPVGPGRVLSSLVSTPTSCVVRVARLGTLLHPQRSLVAISTEQGGQAGPAVTQPTAGVTAIGGDVWGSLSSIHGAPPWLAVGDGEGTCLPLSFAPRVLVMQHHFPIVTIPAGINRCHLLKPLLQPHCVCQCHVPAGAPTGLSFPNFFPNFSKKNGEKQKFQNVLEKNSSAPQYILYLNSINIISNIVPNIIHVKHHKY
jgi:hypothetical protein